MIAQIGVGLALSQQKGSDLIICAAIFASGAAYYSAFLRPRQDRYWSHLTVPEHEAVGGGRGRPLRSLAAEDLELPISRPPP